MGKPGRARKKGRRYPSGGLVPEKKPDDRVRTSRQPHRRGLAPDDRLDERAESPLGRLALKGLIEREHYDAGTRFAEIVGQYRSVIEAPRSTSGSGRGFKCAIEEFRDPYVCDEDPERCACLRRKTRYDAAFEALGAAGAIAAKIVSRVAVHHEEITRQQIVYLRVGLRVLARHFGLTALDR